MGYEVLAKWGAISFIVITLVGLLWWRISKILTELGRRRLENEANRASQDAQERFRQALDANHGRDLADDQQFLPDPPTS